MTPDVQSQNTNTAFQMKSGLYTLTTLELHVATLSLIKKQLQELTKKAPNFFQQTPVIIALDKIKTVSHLLDISSLKYLLYEFGMTLIALKGGDDKTKKAAAFQSIGWLPADKPQARIKHETSASNNTTNIVTIKKSHDTSSPESAQEGPTLSTLEKPLPETTAQIIDRPVRSGQQIYSPGDLIVLAPVSTGAEIVAAGHIHVYGPLRGRALAGVNGNSEACIFSRHFEAELISICGQYKLPAHSDKSFWGGSIVISLKNQSLQMAVL